MLKLKKIIFVGAVALQSFSLFSADWNYNNPLFDPTGQVQIKTLDGVTKSIANNEQRGLASSASPTVLNVQSGGSAVRIKKSKSLTFDSSNLLTFNYYRIYPLSVDLGEDFDLSRSYVEVTQYYPVHSVRINQYNGEVSETTKGATWSFFLRDSRTLDVVHGYFLDGYHTTDYLEMPKYKVTVIEMETGSVASGRIELSTPSASSYLEVEPGELVRYSHQTGFCANKFDSRGSKVNVLWVEQEYTAEKSYLKFTATACMDGPPTVYHPTRPVVHYYKIKP